MIRPRRLRPGSRVALVAPAGPLPAGAIDRAASRVEALGWQPVIAAHAAGRHGYLAGTDEQRLADFTAALESTEIDAIWCLRGGYGTMRIVDRLDLSPLIERPRPLIGFSDNTALHLRASNTGLVSFHGPHPAAVSVSDFSLRLLAGMVEGTRPTGVLPAPDGARAATTLVSGRAEGRLVGGNLSLLAATVGTEFAVSADGAILFIEEVGEPMYRLDRLLTQLRLSGTIEGVVGIAVGAISECADEEHGGNPSIPELIADRLADLGVPVAIGFPFGHVPDNWTLPLGVRAELDASAGTLAILESPVEP